MSEFCDIGRAEISGLVEIITTVNPEIIIMIKLLKSNFHALAATLTLSALSIVFAPAASAITTYDAMAEFTLTLTDVTDASGAQVNTGWDVSAFGSGSVFLNDGGAASANGSVSIIDPAVSMRFLDSITQSSTSSGSATNGFASTDALTDLKVSVDNSSGMALTFRFEFSAMTDATTNTISQGVISNANATVDILDDLGFVNILAIADAVDGNPATGTGDVIGNIVLELLGGETNLISGFVDSYGAAEAVVPVPAAIWLFGSGLLGLVGVSRRKKAT